MNTILQKRIEEAAKEIGKKFYFVGMNPNEAAYKAAIQMGNKILQNQWIPVEEGLPTYDEAVIGMDYMPELAWDDQTIIFVHRSNNPDVVTDKNKFCVYPPRFCKVTHWIPIPELKGVKK